MSLVFKFIQQHTFITLFFVSFFVFSAYPDVTSAADMTSGPPSAPVCVNGVAGTPYNITYQGNGGDVGSKASINFGSNTYYSSGWDGTPQSVYVSVNYTWSAPGTYWFYGIGPSYSSFNNPCYNTGCPGSAGGGPGGGELTGPDGSSTGGPAFCKAVIGSAPPVQADLTAGSVTPVTATAGTSVTLNATVANNGTGSTAVGFTDLFQRATDASGTNTTDIGTYSNAVLASSGSNAATLSYTFPSSGIWYVRACADSASVISESNEGNNCGAWTAVTVNPPAQPDLTAGSITPTSATTSAATSLITTITNSGSSVTGVGFYTLFQSASDASGTGSADIGTYYRSTPLGVGGTFSATLSYTFPSSGTWYVRACSDKSSSADTGVVSESNEANNCGTWTAIAVTTPPPPVFKVCQSSCSSGIQRGNTSSTQSFTIAQGGSQNLVACYNTASGCTDSTGDVTASATWGENAGSNVVSLSGSNPKVVTANTAGTEGISASYSGQTVNMNVNVTCVPTTTCQSSGQGNTFCQNETYTVDDGCGVTLNCNGDKTCDFNWKEVAP